MPESKYTDLFFPAGNKIFYEMYRSCQAEKSLPLLIGSRPLFATSRGCSAVADTQNDFCFATACYYGNMLIIDDKKAEHIRVY